MSISEKLTQIAENEQKVYDKGFSDALELGGYTEVFEAGKQAQYDAFWKAYQGGGYGTTCDYFFAGNGWTNGNLKPKYDIKPARANQMFALSNFNGDLAKHFEDLGITLDFSNCTMVQAIFSNSRLITRVGVLDFSKVTSGTQWFINATGLITIDKLIVSEKTISPEAYAFEGCSKLENITIEGVISKNNWDFRYCPKLSKASIESIISHLDLTEGSPARSIRLSLTAVNNAFEGGADGDEFNSLCASARVANWTISLV